MLKIITINVNGIRAANRKGLFTWLHHENADIICLQEVRAYVDDLTEDIINFNGYYSYFHSSKKSGYSGVAIYTKIKPLAIHNSVNNEDIDDDGRYLQLDYANNLSIISLYVPSGSSSPASFAKKLHFMEHYNTILAQQIINKRNYIICGDFNIAHQNFDLKNWRQNQNNPGCLPVERQWLDNILQAGFIDSWRHIYPDIAGYTWWSNRANAYNNNVGWRIDYQLISKELQNNLSQAMIFKTQRFSDHAPLIVEFNSLPQLHAELLI